MSKQKTNNFNEISPILMASIFIIFIVAMVFVTYFGMNLQSPVAKYFSSYNTKVNNELMSLLKEQKEMDEKILDLSKNGGYTLDKPLVFKAPYKINKTSALIIFNTEEETSVKVSLNDIPLTTVKKSKEHIIPIYQLYADSNNFIKLTLDDGSSKEINIIVESYDNEINAANIKEMIGTDSTYYLGGDLNKDESALRGFDKSENLNSYYSFGYLSGYSFFKNKIALGYKQNKEIKNDIRLDIDYLGRINNITSNISEINYEVNISGDGISYIGSANTLYPAEIDNYSFESLTNTDTYTLRNVLSINEYEHLLTNAVKYDGEFKINYMNDYISITSDVTGKLLMVDSKGVLYSYNIDKNAIIKTDVKGNKSLYIVKDGIVYSLKTTLVD